MALARETSRKGGNVILKKTLYKILFSVFAMATLSSQAQDLVYKTCPKISEIKTLQTLVDGDNMGLPVIDVKQNQSVVISFDYLSDEQPWLSYSLVHCDAEWRFDGLNEAEFVYGFFPVRITDVEPSFNTIIPYYHHKLNIPNEDISLKASGNYAVLIHPEDDLDRVVAVATFSVSEQQAFVSGHVDVNTDIDFRQTHQQLSLSLSWNQNVLPFVNPATDLLLTVRQNRRDETRRCLSSPTIINAGNATYEHKRDLIFEAGNNYRRFEFTDVRYAVLGVSSVVYEPPYYKALLYADQPRAHGSYLYDKDQKGRYVIHALNTDDENIEAEYFKACFMLKAPSSLDGCAIFLQGDFTYGEYTDDFRLEYDAQDDAYYKEVLLKQGAYNYQYVVGNSPSAIEGNYYETPNEYDIYVYYRPSGARYDRLLGSFLLKNE